MHMYGTCFELIHSGFPVLVIRLLLLCFLEAKACVVAKLVMCFALVFFGQEPLKMSRITTFATPIPVFVGQSRIKTLLVLAWRSLFPILLVLHAFAWLVAFSFYTCHWVPQCADDA